MVEAGTFSWQLSMWELVLASTRVVVKTSVKMESKGLRFGSPQTKLAQGVQRTRRIKEVLSVAVEAMLTRGCTET